MAGSALYGLTDPPSAPSGGGERAGMKGVHDGNALRRRNAALLAAAPELVEALERLLAAFVTDAQISPAMPVFISVETNGEAIRVARAALAKAKGE